jgi:hypothetical protein
MEKNNNISDHKGFLFRLSGPRGYGNSQGKRKKRFGVIKEHLLFYHLFFAT